MATLILYKVNFKQEWRKIQLLDQSKKLLTFNQKNKKNNKIDSNKRPSENHNWSALSLLSEPDGIRI